MYLPKRERNFGRRAIQKESKETNFPNGQFVGRNSKLLSFHPVAIYHMLDIYFPSTGVLAMSEPGDILSVLTTTIICLLVLHYPCTLGGGPSHSGGES